MRLFIGLDLDASFRTHLFRLQDQVRLLIGPAAYPKPENFHLTLIFLGDVPEQQVTPLCEALAAIPRVGPFSLNLAGLLCFPPRGPIRVISAAIDEPTGTLASLHAHLQAAAGTQGFAPESRPFHPHITLARAKRSIPSSKRNRMMNVSNESPRVQSQPIDHFSLIHSTLTSMGSLYVPLALFDIILPM